MALTGGAAILARLRSQRAAVSEAKVEKPVVVIAYASQTGTAQDIAQSINAECNERGIKSKVLSLNELKFEGLSPSKTPIVISVVSSTGDGDTPDNSDTFFKDMKIARSNESKKKCFEGMKYTNLGLGDSNYTSFMAVPQRFKKGFDELGAKRFYECREVDEVDGLEELAEEWIEGLWDTLKKALAEFEGGASQGKSTDEKSSSATQERRPSIDLENVSNSLKDLKLPPEHELQGVPAMPVCSIRAVLSEGCSTHSTSEEVENQPSYSTTNRFSAPIVAAEKMTSSGSDREVYLVTVDLQGSGIEFIPGDALDIIPENDPDLVDALLERLHLDGSQMLTVEKLDGNKEALTHIRHGNTLRQDMDILTLCAVLKKTILRFLAQHCADAEETRKLKFLVSKPGREAYQKFIVSAKASLMDILSCFPSCQPTLPGLLELLPPLAPRMYSIACSQKDSRNYVRVAFTLAKYSSPYGDRTGVTTTWLKGLVQSVMAENSPMAPSVGICVRSGGVFHLPEELDRPLILIGPGTGVAPFLGFLQERKHLSKDWSGTIGPSWLFFGCRRDDEDYLFKEELEDMDKDGTITHLHVAFSRQTDSKVYVQHLMDQQSEALYQDIFKADGFVFVCGDGAAMAQDVQNSLVRILVRHAELTEEEAKERLNRKFQEHTYVKDVWS